MDLMLSVLITKNKWTQETLQEVGMFFACVMVIVTWMYNIFTHQIVYINYKKFFVYQLVFNKVGKILKKKIHKY